MGKHRWYIINDMNNEAMVWMSARKRCAEEMDMDLDEGQPCAGAPFSYKIFGPPDAGQRLKAMRTSLLFSELEREQNVEREAERQALQDRDFRELRISADLAARF